MATFSADEMTDMEGEATIMVISKNDWEEPEEMETNSANGGAGDA